MLFGLMAVTGIAAGMLAGGRLSNILEFRIKRTGLMIFAFLLMTVSRLIGMKYPAVDNYNILIHICVYALLLIGLWSNRSYAGIWFIGSGCVLNAFVMMLNSGKMPVSAHAASRAGIAAEAVNLDIRHIMFDNPSEIRFWFLSDIIRLPKILGYGMQIISIGDLVISIGLLLLIFQIIRKGGIGSRENVNTEV